ncbi:MAG: RNB domain-containing ribonuclease, partial [Planctomycetes bacterium]|nr:RNB domain-containing ribonuclease [Planctomycetota bacterium]
MAKRENYELKLRRLLAGREYRPMRSKDMAYLLDIPRREFPEFRSVLGELQEEGLVVRGNDSRWRLAGREERTLVGVLDIALAGHAFLLPDEPDEADLFIPPGGLLDAFDGDQARVKVLESERQGVMSFSGEVIEVIKRARTRIVATILPNGSALVADPRNRYEFKIVPAPGAPAESRRRKAGKADPDSGRTSNRRAAASRIGSPPAGQKVLLEILAWPNEPGGAQARLVEVLGPSGDPDTETAAILAENDAPGRFSEDTLKAVRRLARGISPEERIRRLDLTGEICCTIDPADAHDFDDALGLKENPDGTFTVDVHIADVAHYVRPGSALDLEARDRSTSIYLPERVIPMLPEEISNDICSLRPDEERPAKTVRLQFTPDGERVNYSIHRSLIRSRRRFSYGEVRELVAGKPAADAFADRKLLEVVTKLHRLAMRIRKKRLAGEAIELNLSEYRVIIDAEGRAIALEKVEHDTSHQMVEEFMLAANRVLAEWAAVNTLPALHRLHPPPKEERVEELSKYLTASGYPFKPPFQRRKLKAIIAKVRGRPEEHAVNIMILKSFQQAAYGPDPDIGHFALDFPKYMHFTSPIRRYPDLHLHQALDRVFAPRGGEKKTPNTQTRKKHGGGAGGPRAGVGGGGGGGLARS